MQRVNNGMRWLLLAVLLVAGAAGQTTTTVTGTIKDLAQNVVTSGQVTFELRPGIDTTISGNARFVPTTISCSITNTGQLQSLTGGACLITQNTAIQPAGTYYLVTLEPNFVPTSKFNWYAVGSSQDITTVVPTPATSPAYSFADTVSNQTIGGNKTFSGAVNVRTFESDRYADQFGGSDIGAKINAAIADCASSCTVVVPAGTWNFVTTIVKPRGVVLRGQGTNVTNLHYTGAGAGLVDGDSIGASYFARTGVRDLTLSGPNKAAGTIGMFVGGDPGTNCGGAACLPSTYEAFGEVFHDFVISGFDKGIFWGNNAFMTSWADGWVQNNNYGIYAPSNQTDSNSTNYFSRVSFFGNTAGAVYQLGANIDAQPALNFDHGDFEYNSPQTSTDTSDSSVPQILGPISCVQCHFEEWGGTVVENQTQDSQVLCNLCTFGVDSTSSLTTAQLILLNPTTADVNGQQTSIDAPVVYSAAGHTITQFVNYNANSEGTSGNGMLAITHQHYGANVSAPTNTMATWPGLFLHDNNGQKLTLGPAIVTGSSLTVGSTLTDNGTTQVQNVAVTGSGTVERDSPAVRLLGQCWSGSADTNDYWTLYNQIPIGTNPGTTLSIFHTGCNASSTVALNVGSGGAVTDTGTFTATGLINMNGGANIPNGKSLSGGTLNPSVYQTGGQPGQIAFTGSLTTTAATSDNAAVSPGLTSSSHCSLTPTNSTAASMTGVYVSAKNSPAGNITVAHPATAGATFDVLCTAN